MTDQSHSNDSLPSDKSPESSSKHTETPPASNTPEAEILHKLSESSPEFAQITAMMMGVTPGSNPLHQKITETHITQILDLTSKHDEREFELAKGEQKILSSNRFFFAFGIFLAFLLVIFILWLFKDQPNVLIPILTAIGGFVGGWGSGWGFARKNRK